MHSTAASTMIIVCLWCGWVGGGLCAVSDEKCCPPAENSKNHVHAGGVYISSIVTCGVKCLQTQC